MYIYTVMMRKTGLFLVFFLVFLAMPARAETYDVTFLGIPVVEVDLEETKISDQKKRQFIFTAKTKPFFSRIFRIQNQYIMNMDTSMTRVFQYYKSINQKNIRQELQTTYTGQGIYYSTGVKRHTAGEKSYHTMLSLILALTREKEARIITVPIEMEGVFYRAEARPTIRENHRIEWTIYLSLKGGTPVLESTDLFTSRLGAPEAQRSITICTHTGHIVSARFALPPYALTARLIEE
jgi:hypothetical protein